MKTGIHPAYKENLTFKCACGAEFIAGSTNKEDFHTEICSNCHPFYTGKQKLIDASGRVDKFRAKMEKAEKHVKKNSNTEEAEEEAEELAEVQEELEENTVDTKAEEE